MIVAATFIQHHEADVTEPFNEALEATEHKMWVWEELTSDAKGREVLKGLQFTNIVNVLRKTADWDRQKFNQVKQAGDLMDIDGYIITSAKAQSYIDDTALKQLGLECRKLAKTYGILKVYEEVVTMSEAIAANFPSYRHFPS